MALEYTDLNLLKLQAHLDDDDAAELLLLEADAEAAEQMVARLLRRDASELRAVYGDVPSPVRIATLMLATHLYEHRSPTEPVQLALVPYSVDMLLKPYMRLSD